jgi:hypothetical protein
MAQMQGEIKRNIASLFGGVVIAAIVFVLWMLVTGELGYAGNPVLIAGAVVAVAAGAYVRLADL